MAELEIVVIVKCETVPLVAVSSPATSPASANLILYTVLLLCVSPRNHPHLPHLLCNNLLVAHCECPYSLTIFLVHDNNSKFSRRIGRNSNPCKPSAFPRHLTTTRTTPVVYLSISFPSVPTSHQTTFCAAFHRRNACSPTPLPTKRDSSRHTNHRIAASGRSSAIDCGFCAICPQPSVYSHNKRSYKTERRRPSLLQRRHTGLLCRTRCWTSTRCRCRHTTR